MTAEYRVVKYMQKSMVYHYYVQKKGWFFWHNMTFDFYEGAKIMGRYNYSYLTEDEALQKIEEIIEGNMEYDTGAEKRGEKSVYLD
jgi:hypothetical protein